MVWNPGQQLFGDRYTIERQLGEGGIGITYLAKNRQGNLRVIKTLRQAILNHPAWIAHQSKLKQDFKEEALRLALCRHPHIVEVENVFDEGDLPCMAMEYIAGEDLGKQITEKGALSEAEALEYIRQIGDALILVHEKGLLHRDLKPNNIMMRAGKPEAVLIDFGLARQFISGAVLHHTENLTDGYAPPEQYAPVEERGEYIDVYALAATLYSLLTGQLPMPAPARLQNFTLKPPKDLNPSVSDRVNEAIMKGMALNYKFRPQSVQEWLDLLPDTTLSTTEWYNEAIIILGPRPSGKSVYLATLAYLPYLVKTGILQSIEPLNGQARILIERAKDILAEGSQLPPPSAPYHTIELPVYSLLITLNSNINTIISKEIQLCFTCVLYPGEIFSSLSNNDLNWISEYLDDCAITKYLALIIDATSREDRETAQGLSILESELNRRVPVSEQSQYRIAVMFSHFDLPDVYPYRNNLNGFIDMKFPETQMVLHKWSHNWSCSVAYFAYSAFGMMEDMSEPNCEVVVQNESGVSAVIKNSKSWKPFGLVAPIYWLLTGKYNKALADI